MKEYILNKTTYQFSDVSFKMGDVFVEATVEETEDALSKLGNIMKKMLKSDALLGYFKSDPFQKLRWSNKCFLTEKTDN